jgi:hypothetical protein
MVNTPLIDKLLLLQIGLRNENQRNTNRINTSADRGGMADNVQPPATNRDSHSRRVIVRDGIYSPVRVDVRGAK